MSYPFIDTAIRTLSATHAERILQGLGLTPEHWEMLTGPRPWAVADRAQVRDTFGHVLHGTLDVMGWPRIVLPAEFVAAYVILVVDPVNWMPAARLFESMLPADEIASQKHQQAGGFANAISADALFAMMCRASQDSQTFSRASTFREDLRRAMLGAVDRLRLEETPPVARQRAG